MDELHSQLKDSYKRENLKLPMIDLDALYAFIGPQKHTLFKVLEKYKTNEKEISISFILQFLGWKVFEQEKGDQKL